MNIGIVVAHPDDEVLGCGGSIARWARGGHAVQTLILGQGAMARAEATLADVERLTHQAEEAAHVLGASVHRLTFPDNRFDAVPLLDLCRAVETWLAEVAPHEVYTHHPGCLNVDHRLTAEAVLVATRPIDRAAPRLVASFEVPSATEWAFATTVRPNLFVEVTETLETKIQAMRCYAEEMRPFPHPRSPEMLRALAQRWGAVIGVPAAEAFTILREIR